MCGIIGYVGPRECKPLLLHGLERLEYRGYDSAGIALLEDGGLTYTRAVGNLAEPARSARATTASPATTGLGHTRWATHGGVTEANAHPLAAEERREARDRPERDRRELPRAPRAPRRAGPRLLLRDRRRDRHAPDRGALRGRPRRGRAPRVRRARGPFRLRRDPPRPPRRARRRAAPVPDGRRPRRRARRSSPRTRPRSCARRARCSSPTTARSSSSRPEGLDVPPRRGRQRRSSTRRVELDWDDEGAEKAGYETFMLKEIYEQPDAVAETIGDRAAQGPARASRASAWTTRSSASCSRIVILSAGTVVPRRRRGALRDRGVGARARSSTTSPPSGSTATRCSTRTRS